MPTQDLVTDIDISFIDKTSLSYRQQQRITRLCVRCALLLMQYGAESTVVVDLTKRLGISLGVDGVECALSFNAVTLTTIFDGNCITTARNTMHQAVNIHILVQIQQIVMNAEDTHHKCTYGDNRHLANCHADLLNSVETAFDNIINKPYPNALVITFVGLSCAAFAYLNDGSPLIAMITFLAASVAISIRLFLTRHHFNPFIVVIITAFMATLLGALAYFFRLGDDADIAIAASVLLLVPSFPIINALSDILKGYINMGLGRWVWATMLTLSACVGIVMALILLGVSHWGLA